MQSVTPALLSQLIENHFPPCVSMYVPLSPGNLDARNRTTSLRNRLRQHLNGRHDRDQAEQVIEKIESALNGGDFWSKQAGTTAGIFASPDYFMVIDLPREVPEQIVVADTFHIKPLIRIMQTAGRFEVLCLTQRNVELYQGNRDRLEKVELPKVPHTISEALGEENIAPFMSNATWTGADEPGRGTGQSSRREAYDTDLDRFFRAVDKALWETHARAANLPLVLCAVEEYHDRFQSVSKNPRLLKEGIHLNPDSLTVERLRQEAWKVVEPYFHQQTEFLIDRFRAARAHHTGSDQLPQVAEAAARGRVDTLLVDADAHIPGRMDSASGQIFQATPSHPNVDDLLDETAETVLKGGGMVMVLPHNLMPTDTGVAAIYRY